MSGFVFPALTFWSGGDDAVIVETPDVPQPFSELEFLRRSGQGIFHLLRDEIEDDFFTLVSAVVKRVSGDGVGDELREGWDRVLESFGDEEERQYCIAAGRLGIDPYDPDAPDISGFADGISESLFADVCDAT